ncbi:hypothetical protein [Novosphingobium sp.]|uniref:hypothetical protein n=1 Tax=Novosphingobium sp. TaxID=1874826 RepID=UPI0038B79EB9
MSQFKAFRGRLKRYFTAYGGWTAVLSSPLFLMSVALSAIGYSEWMQDKWSLLTQSLLPNLLGFSLGTYSILFGLLTGRMRAALKTKKNASEISYLDEINATFFHFIFVQVIALLWAIIYNGSLLHDLAHAAPQCFPFALTLYGYAAKIGGFIGYGLLIYSISLAIASALVVYRLASIVDPAPPHREGQ